MKLNAHQTKLNNLIFESRDINQFNDFFEGLDIESQSDIDFQKNRALYLWIFISVNSETCSHIEKNKFIVKYNKYLSTPYNKLLKINERADKYMNESIIIEHPLNVFDEFKFIVNEFNDFEDIKIFESKIKGILNNQKSKPVLKAFLNDDIIDSYIVNELFRLAENYNKAIDLLSKRESYRILKGKIKEYIEKISSCKTYCCVELILPFAMKLLELSSVSYSKYSQPKPANINVIASEKKYPFYCREKEINIEILINNNGEGVAYDFKFNIYEYSNTIEIKKTDFYIGNIEIGNVALDLKIINKFKSETILLKVDCSWVDIDECEQNEKFEINFICQKENIDWNSLAKNKPYNLEPITSEEKLIGRLDILNEFNTNIKSNNIESYILYGQKRTGKTSIVKTFETIIKNLNSKDVKVSYIDGGDISYPEVKDIISNFGLKMCKFIKDTFKQTLSVETPIFSDALAPIDNFLNSVVEILPDIKIVFVIDEFDEFIFDLYKGKYADSFFQTIRSISSKPNFGFILVGGEKMDVIKKHQGYRLNKFKIISVSYFDKESNYTNFVKLVRKPLTGKLEISDEGIALIHEYTSGNPYFTKLICMNIFDIMLSRKDSSITIKEVKEGVQETLIKVASNSFHHFWMDGILNEEEKKEELFDDRRKLLLSFADSLRVRNATKEMILEFGENNYYLKPIISEDLLREFIRRDVLIKDNNEYHCKVKLFENWLIDKGITEIISSSSSTDSILKEKLLSEQDYVNSKEIYELVNSWGGNYRGKPITEDAVRSWLNQFGDNTNQKLAFSILKGLKFYNSSLIREKLSTSFSIVIRNLNKYGKERTIKHGERTRKDLIVSYLDGPAKSGAYYAKQFADENNIYHQNVIERNRIKDFISKSADDVNAIIFIDDIIGTGKSIDENLLYLSEDVEFIEKINEKQIIILIVAITGFAKSKDKLLEKISMFKFFDIHLCDPIGETNKVFADTSDIFQSKAERLKALDIATKFGEKLEKNNPLGYNNSQVLVVFEQNCPNNSLPIIWKEKANWTPLFKRV